MNSVVISTVVVPGFVSLLLYIIFFYLREQSRQAYFRAWELAWAFYTRFHRRRRHFFCRNF